MTMAELARRSGVPYHQIHTWTRRENAMPNAKSLEKVAEALGVTTGHLLNGDPFQDLPSGVREKLLHEVKALSEEDLRILLAAAEQMRAARET